MPGKSLPFFALIIGIDIYADSNITNLCAAKEDAEKVNEFLVQKLHVSQDCIKILLDENATRKDIIEAMRNLANNPEISKDDPILIYYAGHGGEAPPPIPDWVTSSTNGKVQMLLPHDFNFNGSKDIQGQGIFDIEISSILSEIANKKSDNIVVIFDCCHSGSGTRNGLTARGVNLPIDYAVRAVPNDFLQPPSCQKTGLQTHVLLAACEHDRPAFEDRYRGLFTKALLPLLEEGINRLSYRDVIKRIDLPSQAPQCEGIKSDRIIFTVKADRPRPAVYNIKPIPGKLNQFTLDSAGQAHGITNGAKFAVYSDENLSSEFFIGDVVVSEQAPSTSQCSIIGVAPFTILNAAYAVQISRPEGQRLRLYIDQKDQSYPQIIQLIQPLHDNIDMDSVRIVNAGAGPDLSISTFNGRVRFGIENRICREHGLTHMFFDVKVEDHDAILSILRRASNFYCLLDLSNSHESNPFTDKVHVECLKVMESGGITHNFVAKPDNTNLNNGGSIFIWAGDKEDMENDAELYGYRITNDLDRPLYVALFYFDMSDLSIKVYYLPPTANNGKVDFSLPAQGSLAIGFGDGGWYPCSYYLRENQPVDVGFLKLYVSTKYIDYSGISQSPPFDNDRARATAIFKSRPKEAWGTMIIPIVQKRRRVSG